MLVKQLRDFYCKLQDDESKRVFCNRLNYYITRDESHLKKMIIGAMSFWEVDIINFVHSNSSGKRIVLYGAGTTAKAVLEYLHDFNITVDCFCDSNSEKWGTYHYELPVIPNNSLNRETDLIIISTSVYQEEIYKYLLKNGFKYVYQKAASYGCQYFQFPRDTSASKNEVYLDVGCLDGRTIMDFVNYAGGEYEKIYGFEPDPVAFEKTEKFIRDKKIENVVMLSKGAWSSICTLSFNDSPNGSGSACISTEGSLSIQCTTIDSVVKDDAVTFIKMDIEGTELEALKGAAGTIVKNKPRLAICIYHKPEDIWEIPLYIQELVPEYNFFIRHHAIIPTETVLYAQI